MIKLLIALLSLITYAGYGQEHITLDDNIDCGLEGTARPGSVEYEINPYKNRSDMPVSFDNSYNLSVLATKKAVKNFPKKTAVRITGYCINVKQGGPESCNCKARQDKDTHIELVVSSAATDKKYRVVVEVTPRMRKHVFNGATTAELKKILMKHTITVEGWLFCDLVHKPVSYADSPDGAKIERASCWEVHPVTHIAVN
jgi:hypothetical protein